MLNLVISPISAVIPAAKTGPMPYIEQRHSNSCVCSALTALSIALSKVVASFSKAFMQLNNAAIAALSGLYKDLSSQ
ncbi:hypothetical protein ACYUJ6_11510 [Clostridium sp. JNZ X4-2]